MSSPRHAELAAELLDQLGTLAGSLGPAFGPESAAAGIATKALTHGIAEAIRRGVSPDQLVVTLRHISPLEMPWSEAVHRVSIPVRSDK